MGATAGSVLSCVNFGLLACENAMLDQTQTGAIRSQPMQRAPSSIGAGHPGTSLDFRASESGGKRRKIDSGTNRQAMDDLQQVHLSAVMELDFSLIANGMIATAMRDRPNPKLGRNRFRSCWFDVTSETVTTGKVATLWETDRDPGLTWYEYA